MMIPTTCECTDCEASRELSRRFRELLENWDRLVAEGLANGLTDDDARERAARTFDRP